MTQRETSATKLRSLGNFIAAFTQNRLPSVAHCLGCGDPKHFWSSRRSVQVTQSMPPTSLART